MYWLNSIQRIDTQVGIKYIIKLVITENPVHCVLSGLQEGLKILRGRAVIQRYLKVVFVFFFLQNLGE